INAPSRLETGQKRRLNEAARADLRGAPRACGADPYGRMRLLQGTRPNVDASMMKETAFMAERTVMLGPAFDDEIERLPMTLIHAHGIAVRRQNLIRHAA